MFVKLCFKLVEMKIYIDEALGTIFIYNLYLKDSENNSKLYIYYIYIYMLKGSLLLLFIKNAETFQIKISANFPTLAMFFIKFLNHFN